MAEWITIDGRRQKVAEMGDDQLEQTIRGIEEGRLFASPYGEEDVFLWRERRRSWLDTLYGEAKRRR